MRTGEKGPGSPRLAAMTTLTPAPNPRLPLIDVLRGVALAAMIAYHFFWDLAFLGFFYDITSDARWIWFQRSILSSFLLLVGIGLALGHGEGIRWRGFWRRWLILVLAAGAMSLGTYIAFGEGFAFFGILHAIAVFSLAGLLFVRAPWWMTLAVGMAVIVVGASGHNPLFNTRWLAWVGFWTDPPYTADLVAVFPWFGVVLIGIVLGRLLPWRQWRWGPAEPVGRTLRVMGRWSLLTYLLHQPVMLSVLYPLALWIRSRAG